MVAVSRSTRRPVILLSITADSARESVLGELERRYAADYLIIETQTAARACEVLSEVADRGEQVALILADDPSAVDGDETIFTKARRLFPMSGAVC